MIRPSTQHTSADSMQNQAAQQYMGSYIIMPQAAAMGMSNVPGISNQSMVNQALQMQQQILLPQMAGYSMQFPFLQRKFYSSEAIFKIKL